MNKSDHFLVRAFLEFATASYNPDNFEELLNILKFQHPEIVKEWEDAIPPNPTVR